MTWAPWVYTYRTRIGSAPGLAMFLLPEFVVPATAVVLAFDAPVWVVGVVLLANLSTYELGYLINDTAPGAGESDGDRLEGPVPRAAFVSARVGVLCAAALATYATWGVIGGVLFTASNLALVGLLALHSAPAVTARRGRRMTTFTACAALKYAPLVLPAAGLRDGWWVLLGIFWCYGLARVVAYLLRKVRGWRARDAHIGQLCAQILALLVLTVPALRWLDQSGARYAIAVVWTGYAITWGLSVAISAASRLWHSNAARLP